MTPGLGEIFSQFDQATSDAQTIVAQGKARFLSDRRCALAGQAVARRVGELATILPDAVRAQIPEVPWSALRAFSKTGRGQRTRSDPEVVWDMLDRQIPDVARSLGRWQGRHLQPMERRIRRRLGPADRAVSRGR